MAVFVEWEKGGALDGYDCVQSLGAKTWSSGGSHLWQAGVLRLLDDGIEAVTQAIQASTREYERQKVLCDIYVRE